MLQHVALSAYAVTVTVLNSLGYVLAVVCNHCQTRQSVNGKGLNNPLSVHKIPAHSLDN